MAGKEATVFIVDLGRSMGEKRHGRSKTNLEWSMEYVWDRITSTVATNRKSALMNVVAYRTDETDVEGVIEDDDGYNNVRLLTGSKLKQFLLKDIRDLQQEIKSSKTDDGDLFSALTVAMTIIDNGTRGANGNLLKYDRRIVIVTDGQGAMYTDDLDAIADRLKEVGIQMTLLGLDFDDPESGYKEEDKDSVKAENELMLRDFVENKCDGAFGTIAEALEQLEIPRLKEVRPVPSYRGTLTLGDAANYDCTLTIDVERYPCTMIAKPPTASSYVEITNLGPTQSSATLAGDEPMNGDLSAVRHMRSYQVDNPEEPGTKMNVEPDDLERGYEYGRTAVHISESESNIVNLETTQGLELIGFVQEEKFERYLTMNRTNYIVAGKGNFEQSQLALSSFVHALYEAQCYGVARLVTKPLKPPVMVLLIPRLEPRFDEHGEKIGDFECLTDVELPFEEDMRRYKFPPLDKKLTISGKVITEHRDLPNSDLMDAMSNYVDSMDLSTLGRDDDGEPTEYMKFEDTYSPLLHRINQVIKWRAINEIYDKLPEPPQILMKYSAPPPDLIAKTEKQLNALKAAGDVKKVPPKQKGRGKRRREDRDKPLSGLDVDELLGNPKRVKVEPGNLIPSFKQALAATDDLAAIQTAADEMGQAIKDLISSSIGESGYGRALEAIRVLRDELTELEEPGVYNKFIRELKKDILEGNLKGDRRGMWWSVRGNKYGLVDRKRCFASDVNEEEAAAFYKS